MEPLSVDVAIVGGGPAGLALARSLMRKAPDLKVKVYESGRKLREMGAGVLININGWRALQSIDPEVYDRLQAVAMRLGPMVWYNEDGSLNRKVPTFPHERNLETFGMTQAVAPWYQIRQALYDALPPEMVEMGVQGAGYVLDAGGGGVTLNLQRRAGEEGPAPPPVHARVLVGGDGYFSRVREQLLGDGPPDFTGRVTWRARVRWEDSTLPAELADDAGLSALWINPATIGKGRYVIVYPVGGGEFVWTATAPVARMRAAGHDFTPLRAIGDSNMSSVQTDGSGTANTKQRCLDTFADFPEAVKAMLEATPAETVTEHGFYIRLPEAAWGRGPVTLVGDAAHVAPPDGQGANLALEDAAVLAECIAAMGPTPEALRVYERNRLPRVKGVLSLPEGNPQRQGIIETPFLPFDPDAPEPPPPPPKAAAASANGSDASSELAPSSAASSDSGEADADSSRA